MIRGGTFFCDLFFDQLLGMDLIHTYTHTHTHTHAHTLMYISSSLSYFFFDFGLGCFFCWLWLGGIGYHPKSWAVVPSNSWVIELNNPPMSRLFEHTKLTIYIYVCVCMPDVKTFDIAYVEKKILHTVCGLRHTLCGKKKSTYRMWTST